MSVRFVLISAFCDPRSQHYAGYTAKAVRRKIEEGVWRIGQVLRKAPDGHITIDLEGYNKWVAREKVATCSCPISSPLPAEAFTS